MLLDIWLPDVDGITLLKEWAGEGELEMPVIVMSGHGTVETAVEATRLGAYDFLEKPLSLAKLLLTVERALQAEKLRRENVGLRRRAQAVAEPIGRSPLMQSLREQVQRIAQHDSRVLMSGEPGSGKQTFARYLHQCSNRKDGPLVMVGVAAIARENSAAELFGTETGETIHFGRLEQANGGILFLEDIADMDPETQARLVSAVESRSFRRLGGTEAVKVDVRIVAATHRNLEQEVRAGRFREDLYYHLNVVPLQIPPLREHSEDVPDLLNYYVNRYVDQENLAYRHFSLAAQNRLRQYPWPGNVRELNNLVQRLLILGNGQEITPDEVEKSLGGVAQAVENLSEPQAMDLPLREAREQFERAYLEHQLRAAHGNVTQVANRAGIERTHLYRKLKALGIDPKQVSSEK